MADQETQTPPNNTGGTEKPKTAKQLEKDAKKATKMAKFAEKQAKVAGKADGQQKEKKPKKIEEVRMNNFFTYYLELLT